MFLGCANAQYTKWMLCVHVLQPGNICCRHTMFLKKIRNNFCVKKFVSTTNVACANGETFVSATMCSRLAGPLNLIISYYVESFFRTPNFTEVDSFLMLPLKVLCVSRSRSSQLFQYGDGNWISQIEEKHMHMTAWKQIIVSSFLKQDKSKLFNVVIESICGWSFFSRFKIDRYLDWNWPYEWL